MSKFSEFIKSKRKKHKQSLRSFCKRYSLDVAYISRLENGIIQPPQSDEKLRALAIAYGFKPETEDWILFFDLARTIRGEIPKDIEENFPQVLEFLPAFYRRARNQKVTKKKLQDLLDGVFNLTNEQDNGPKP